MPRKGKKREGEREIERGERGREREESWTGVRYSNSTATFATPRGRLAAIAISRNGAREKREICIMPISLLSLSAGGAERENFRKKEKETKKVEVASIFGEQFCPVRRVFVTFSFHLLHKTYLD